jgi:hypothetical protein
MVIAGPPVYYRVRLILALIGLLIAEVGYWAAGQRINFITIAFRRPVCHSISYLCAMHTHASDLCHGWDCSHVITSSGIWRLLFGVRL